jgi:hypothetical protein
LASEGFAPISGIFLESYAKLQPPLTPTEAMLVVHLFEFKWDARMPWPSVKTLAGRLGCSPRYVRKLCERLESVGYLSRIEKRGDSNRYDISGLIQALERYVDKAATGGRKWLGLDRGDHLRVARAHLDAAQARAGTS